MHLPDCSQNSYLVGAMRSLELLSSKKQLLYCCHLGPLHQRLSKTWKKAWRKIQGEEKDVSIGDLLASLNKTRTENAEAKK